MPGAQRVNLLIFQAPADQAKYSQEDMLLLQQDRNLTDIQIGTNSLQFAKAVCGFDFGLGLGLQSS